MINPNLVKLVTVLVADDLKSAQYKGQTFRLVLFGERVIQPGKRRLYLRYSIAFDEYYVSDRG
jgi:hypothetical protein